MEKQKIDQAALNNLIARCKNTISNLAKALDSRNVEAAKMFLFRAETFRDALESKMPPSHRHQGADFLKIKGLLDDAIADGSVKLYKLDDFTNKYSDNVYGMFNASAHVRGSVNVDEFGLGLQETNAVP